MNLWAINETPVPYSTMPLFRASDKLGSSIKTYPVIIGVGRFRILGGGGGGGGQGLEFFWGGQGGPNPQQALDVVTTSMRRNDVISASCGH